MINLSGKLADPITRKSLGCNLLCALQIRNRSIEEFAKMSGLNANLLYELCDGQVELSVELVVAVSAAISILPNVLFTEFKSYEERSTALLLVIQGKPLGGEKEMSSNINLSQGHLNDPQWRQNFGVNVGFCLQHTGMTAASLGVRAEISEDNVKLLLAGKLSLSNNDVQAICEEIGLSVNNLIMDYISNDRRSDLLLAKLKAAGRIKPEPQTCSTQTSEVTATSTPAAFEIDSPHGPMTIGPPLLAEDQDDNAGSAPIVEEVSEKEKVMAKSEKITWEEDDVTGTANGQTFHLRKKELRKTIGERIKATKDEKRPELTWSEILNKCHLLNRSANWIHNVSYGTGTIDATELETLAEFFGVSVLSLLTGEFDTLPAESTHNLIWSKDGITATDESSGKVFDLSDAVLSGEVVRRIQLLCPTDTTMDQLLDDCGIDESSGWFAAAGEGRRQMEESHIDAFADFFNVTDYALLTGEGLNLPDAVVETEEASLVDDATDKASETQPEAALLEEAAAATGADAEAVIEAVEAQPSSTAIQTHFRQRLLSEEFELAGGVSPRALMAATQASHVDWVTVYFTMTDVGVHTLEQVHALAEQFGGEPSLNSEIVNRILSMSRIR